MAEPGMGAGRQEQLSQLKYVWDSWPHRGHGRSCERWVSLVCTVSHMAVSPPKDACRSGRSPSFCR
jgi:hypothetical protein